MTLSDREILKERAAGQAQSYGLAGTPKDAVAAVHSGVYTFDVGSDATIAEMGQRAERAFRIVSQYFTPTTALAAHATAYVTMLVQKRDGAGGAAVTCGTIDTSTGGENTSLAAFVPTAFTATSTAADLVFAAGNVLTFKSTEASTPTTPIGKVTVYVEYI